MEALARLWERARHPEKAFRDRAAEAPPLVESLKGLLAWRAPVAFLGMVIGYLEFGDLYARLVNPDGAFWTGILQAVPLDLDPRELRSALAELPPLPGLHGLLPWMVLLAPLAVLSIWVHDATFDHIALWMLGGLKSRKGFRASLSADAEALQVGVLGAAAGLLGSVPGVGWILAILLLPVAAYFWVLRGWALAAWHGCPVWKGVLATILHVVLVGVTAILLLVACLIMVMALVQ